MTGENNVSDAGANSANSALGRYVERCRKRLAWIARARIAAAGVGVVTLLTLALAAGAAYLVPSQGWIVAARVLLYAACGATILACLLRRISAKRAARGAERRVTAFDGQLVTWLDASRRRQRPALLPQLARSTLRIVDGNPPRRVAPGWLFAPPLVVVTAAAIVLLWSYQAAPQSWRLPAERLWLGDLFADTRPQIVVEPGDTVVPRGADVLVRARAHGFAAASLDVNASFAGSGRWERAGMMPSSRDEFREFVLVGVSDPVDYYVSAAGINSDRFRIEVADLPVITKLDVALTFPAWTRLEGRTQDHGDVAGVEGTEVAIAVEANRPLGNARLVVGGTDRNLDGGRSTFTIESPGTWHVAVTHRGQVVRISDEYLIDVVHDRPPEVDFTFPGRDRSATAIEEVFLRFGAKDDFGVDALTLRYAVNGGAWTDIEGSADGDTEASLAHMIQLEGLRDEEDKRPLRPGDLVSFHVLAEDHRQSTRSALYFVDVRPFDKRYRDTGVNQDGGGGGGGGGGEQELSNRQREILNATWNVILERDTGVRAGADLDDQVDLIGILQGTLKEQVDTLVARAEGRRLSDDDEVEPFVAELNNASEQMAIAAERLAERELDDAVRPEQRALQHLLTAEAGLRNVDVTMSRGGRGSGDAVSRSLSELFELETDPEKNRYEQPQEPGAGQGQEEAEEEWKRLTELARRQEELAREQERAREQTPMSRWQLERLQRELDSLRDRLAGDENQQSSQDGQRPQDGAQRSGAQQGGRSDGRPIAGRTPRGETLDDLDRARESIERSLERDASGETATDAFRQGAEALRQGAEQILQDSRDAVASGLRDAERRVSELVDEQEQILERLESFQEEVLDAVRRGQSYPSRRDDFLAEAENKRDMRRDLESVAADVARLREELARSDGEDADLATMLDRALDDLATNRVAEHLSITAEYFELGRPLYISGRERRIHDALQRLQTRLGLALERLDENADGNPTAQPGIAEVQGLRRDLVDVGAGGDPRALGNIARAVARLAGELEDSGELDFSEDQRAYRGLGASPENRERLYRLTLAELDRLEIALGKVDGAAIRAEEPRDEGYDSDAVARYFRELSGGGAP